MILVGKCFAPTRGYPESSLNLHTPDLRYESPVQRVLFCSSAINR